MGKRITLVACFDNKSNKLITNILSKYKIKNLCKVPYNIENRTENDTLPYHITLSAWNESELENILPKLQTLSFNKITTKFKFSIMESTIKGKILYLKPLELESISNLQTRAYNILPTQKYNPENFTIHATIAIDEDRNKIDEIYNLLKDETFELTINKICLFEIYPAKLIK